MMKPAVLKEIKIVCTYLHTPVQLNDYGLLAGAVPDMHPSLDPKPAVMPWLTYNRKANSDMYLYPDSNISATVLNSWFVEMRHQNTYRNR